MNQHTDERVRLTVRDGIADVRLMRAAKMNALDPDMFDALLATGEALMLDTSVRSVLLSGEGRAFCAGLDMASFERMREADKGGGDGLFDEPLSARTHGIANAAQRICTIWRDLPVPVIAAVHGVAFGGGLQLALGADMRIVAPDAKLSVMEIKWGLVPDMAGIWLLRELVRPDVVRELTYTGRQVGGEEALKIGLATTLAADPYAAALEVASMIARQSPDAIRAAKRLLNLPSHDPAAVLLAESVEQAKLIGSPNQVEAVTANIEKRAAQFAE
ncbi:crotonase/enoyl-CoA hydratase family protein [Noviherbaspirillum pedocola]|uniref:Crotonase/enoyl-CoA hydratase family protein n=1 Tax=Noviherbaspirillum pedocola TaxID=2801341 RepID=A0A934T0H0_9BURK|nr:crotonase/enoyl-CoA hydratase family protein [Noviherbaspirillum pedocola]MBK4738725.1 crotonase/enoyl-CoA hydratase family protein [Noviherbaspirillum pedocola]